MLSRLETSDSAGFLETCATVRGFNPTIQEVEPDGTQLNAILRPKRLYVANNEKILTHTRLFR